MKILKSWLKDYIEIDKSDEEIAELLSLSGTIVEDFESTLPASVIVVEIKSVAKHPNADRLQIATVFDGKADLQIVCGAPNIAAGQKVPLAQVGTILGEGFEIKKAEIRGVESVGMLCAEDELGLGADHSGIIIFPDDYEVGQPISKYLDSDTVFEVEITPNRGDELSHLGVARELKALLQSEIKQETIDLEISPDLPSITVTIEAKELCPQYFALRIDGVKISDSPEWLKKRISACGFRPINNVVDITNYILLDLGQPMHAFDATKIEGGITIRTAHDGEGTVTLDGSVRALDEEMLVVADDKEAIALAGVMGGANSEVSDKTESIVLEAAEFDRRSIRKTAKTLNLISDASYRFERGIDSANIEFALKKAARLILELAGGKVASVISRAGSKPAKTEVIVDYAGIDNLLGDHFAKDQINQILVNLGFETGIGRAIVPSWRHDITIWQDLAEEIARIIGYDNLPRTDIPTTQPPVKSDYFYKEYLKDIFVDQGFSEIYSYAFLSEQDLKVLNIESDNLLEVANPVQPENKYLRKSIIPSLLKAVAKNPTFDPVLLFEIGHAFTTENENVYLSAAAAGKNAKNATDEVIGRISEISSVPIIDFNLRELTREEVLRFKIKKPVIYTFEIDVEKLIDGMKKKGIDPTFKLIETKGHYRPLSKYPSLTRDLAFIVDANCDTNLLSDLIFSNSDQINRVELFDEFVSDKFGQGKKNIAYHLYLQDMDRTMTDGEADVIIAKIVSEVASKFDGKLRDK